MHLKNDSTRCAFNTNDHPLLEVIGCHLDKNPVRVASTSILYNRYPSQFSTVSLLSMNISLKNMVVSKFEDDAVQTLSLLLSNPQEFKHPSRHCSQNALNVNDKRGH